MRSAKAAPGAPARQRSSVVGDGARHRRPLAAADILDTWDHIAEDSIEQAGRRVDKLDEIIATQPLMGRAREELAAGVRSFPFGRYLIFYEPTEGGIDVVRVLHSARDIDAIFGEDQ